jgi:hypothetical protein
MGFEHAAPGFFERVLFDEVIKSGRYWLPILSRIQVFTNFAGLL